MNRSPVLTSSECNYVLICARHSLYTNYCSQKNNRQGYYGVAAVDFMQSRTRGRFQPCGDDNWFAGQQPAAPLGAA